VPLSIPPALRRVPTHAFGVFHEQREYPPAAFVAFAFAGCAAWKNAVEKYPVSLVTRDISSTGVFFLCPKTHRTQFCNPNWKSSFVSRPLGRGKRRRPSPSQKCAAVESANMPGWVRYRRPPLDDLKFRPPTMKVPTYFPSVLA